MTALTAERPVAVEPATTASSPTGRDLWRLSRGPLAIAVLIGVIAVIAVLVQPNGRQGLLDPDATSREGSHALATLLRERGIEVTRVTSVAEVLSDDARDTTVLVTRPTLLPRTQLQELATGAADLVVVTPDSSTLDDLGVAASVVDVASIRERGAGCSLRAAVLAGSAETGGVLFGVSDPDLPQCYTSGGAPSLVQLRDGARAVTLIGAPTPFTNGRIAHSGNAALTMNLLGAKPRVVWLVPSFQSAVADSDQKSLVSLLPDRLWLIVGQLAFAVFVLALWRARRLGPVVSEPLPVVVRAAETVEGRARLYEAARAHDRAADALRSAARNRLAGLLGLPPDVDPAGLTQSVTGRSGRSAVNVHELLYGAAPPDDAALVRLADDLDALSQEVRRS